MMTRHYQINSRNYTSSLALNNENNLSPDKNYLFDLSYLSIINIVGERAVEFLQGQLSCDVHQVNINTMRQGALCNLKGRVLALLDVVQWQGHQLILPTDLAEETMASLAKVAMVSRVSLHQPTGFKLYGFYLSNENDVLPIPAPLLPREKYAVISNENSLCYAIGEGYYIIVVKNDAFIDKPFVAAQQLLGSLEWHRLQLERFHIEIYPDTRKLFLPHRLNLPGLGFINFEKGCYKGQEIIARTHYRAKLKHSLKKFLIHTKEQLTAGQKLYDVTSNAEIGELIDFCPSSREDYLIVVSILHEHPQNIIIEGHTISVTLKGSPN